MATPRPTTVPASRLRALTGSLFDRLIADEEELDPPSDRDIGRARVVAIKRNLSRVLNLRIGGAAANPKLGIIDMNDGVAQSRDMILEIIHSIRSCILSGEPRIKDVQVVHVHDSNTPLDLRFRIAARLAMQGDTQHVEFNISLSETRDFVVN